MWTNSPNVTTVILPLIIICGQILLMCDNCHFTPYNNMWTNSPNVTTVILPLIIICGQILLM